MWDDDPDPVDRGHADDDMAAVRPDGDGEHRAADQRSPGVLQVGVHPSPQRRGTVLLHGGVDLELDGRRLARPTDGHLDVRAEPCGQCPPTQLVEADDTGP